MIENVQLPTHNDLQALVNEALKDNTVEPDDFLISHLAGIRTILESNPLAYRAYGAYWWAVKGILVHNGFAMFGKNTEEPTASHFYIYDDLTTLCAAWFYQNEMTKNGNRYNPIHIYIDDTIDTHFEYSLEDDHLEKMAANKSVKK